MKRQFLSIILSVTLLASAIAGAISVSIKLAKAEAPGSYDPLIWNDFLVLASNNAHTAAELNFLESVSSICNQYKDDQNFNIVVINYGNKYAAFGFRRADNTTGFYIRSWSAGTTQGGGVSENYNNQYVSKRFYFVFEDQVGFSTYWTANSTDTIGRRSTAFGFGVNEYMACWPTRFEQQGSGYYVYNLRTITAWDTQNAVSSPANILWERPVEIFQWVKFNIGERWFLTVSDQSYVYGLWNDGEGGFNRIFLRWYADWMEDPDDNVWLFQLTPFNISSVPAVNAPTSLINISGDHFYALDITDIIDGDVQGVTDGRIIHYVEDTQGDIVRATEIATHEDLFSLVLTPDQENISLDQAWQQINEYYNTYNTTHVVPQDLADVLFGLNGSQMYPCNISVPATVWDNSPEADGGTSAAPIHNWKWWYPSGNDVNIGFNYDLFDTVILTYSSSGEYTLINYYDDTLTNPFMAVSNLTFDQIVNQFDIVIIVPDDDGCLSNSWWKTVMNTILNNLGADLPFDFLNTQAIAGSGSQGVEHISSRPGANAHILQGFAILTYKAIQKQQLWNFNDGITKLYQLQVEYIESEDLWKDSFLLWSSSIFNMLNSLDGRLTTINTNLLSISSLLESIKTAVENIANSDDPDNLQPWYLSLWNWITNFRPSDSDFSATLNQYDNNWEDFPELPAPSTVPLLPGGE